MSFEFVFEGMRLASDSVMFGVWSEVPVYCCFTSCLQFQCQFLTCQPDIRGHEAPHHQDRFRSGTETVWAKYSLDGGD